MMQKIDLRKLLAACVGLFVMAATVHVYADAYLNKSLASGQDLFTSATAWTPNGVPATGQTYYVGTQTDGSMIPGYVLGNGNRINGRTPNNSSAAVWPGGPLIINTSGTLFLKGTNNGTITIPDLRMQGFTPWIYMGNTNTQTIDGVMTLSPDASSYANIRVNDNDSPRHIKLACKVTGSGNLRLEGRNGTIGNQDHGVEFNNDTNDFTGMLYTYYNSSILVNVPHGLGNATTVTVTNKAQLRVADTVSVYQPNTNLVVQTGSWWWLNSPSQTYKSIKMPGSRQLKKGTYLASDINAIYYPGVTTATVAGGAVTVTEGLPEVGVPREVDGTVTTCTFGNVNVWFPNPTADVVITNVGDKPINFVQRYDQAMPTNPGIVVQNNPTTSTFYSLVSCTPPSTNPLPVGGTMTVRLRFNCTPADLEVTTPSLNLRPGTLRIYSDGVNGNVAVPLRGTTVPVEVSRFSID